MTDWSEASIRRDVRQWLEAHWEPNAPLVEWRRKLAASGWGMPQWPKQWFGQEVPQRYLPTVQDEFNAFGAVSVAKVGIRILAAETILAHAADHLKDRYIEKILTGEHTWCQLFSEPGSGSDLAGATTRADEKDDHWLVNGQKVWTTSAHHADFGLLLARTDWDVPKHQGLSYFVIDMRQSGVQVHPLKQMNGHASFNQVFFTDALVAKDDQIGSTGQGWQIAMTTLMHERRNSDLFSSGVNTDGFEGSIYQEEAEERATVMEPYKWYPQRAGRVDLAIPRAKETGRIEDAATRQELAKLLIMHRSAEWTAKRAKAAQAQGQPQGPEGSLGKLAASNIAKQASIVHTMINQSDAMLKGKDSPLEGLISEILISVPAISIAGGTDEIQRNIIAERVLKMEKEPRMDGGPFKDVRKN